MDFSALTPFIKQAAVSPHAQMASLGSTLSREVLEQDEEKSTVDSVVHDKQLDSKKPKDEVDLILSASMPELEKTDESPGSEFGKAGMSLWDQLKKSIR